MANISSIPPPGAPKSPLVRLRALTKSYPEGEQVRTVLHELSGEFGAGEFVALIGRSGSGKSTLLNLVSGIDVPTAGEVSIAGTDLTRLSERERTLFRRAHIGFIFQFFNLISTLTVLENVLLPLELQGRLGPAELDQGRQLLTEVGLADRADSFPDRLSGGEQQRVAIARALVHRPRLLLADEPTGNLDADTGAQVLALLERLVRGAGGTMLLVTHSAEVARLADRILTLRGGRLVEAAEVKP
ncbi:MAG: ABC transporter ATP-binding protein [Desulfuromonadales bacterium]|nr:ABC transporter ATP-binding protein [Desulfuromonadales bacterium]